MRTSIWLGMVLQMAFLGISLASTMNYQGRLTGTNGAPVNGSVAISVNVYNDAEAGTALYTESMGSVAVANGIFSFDWGGAGTSLVSVVETMGTTTGANSVFNYTTLHKPINSSSVTIGDGTYSWSDVSGSSSPGNFLGSVGSYPNGTVSAIYLSGNPSAGRTITIAYKYNSTGCDDTVQVYSNLWLGVTIDGVEMTPRRFMGSVPRSIIANTVKGQTLYVDDLTGRVGIGTNTPSSSLTVNGVIETTSGGVKFPDGTVQTTAVTVQTNTILIGWWITNGAGANGPSLKSTAPIWGNHYFDLPNGSKILRMYGQLYDSYVDGGNSDYVSASLASVGTNGVTTIGSISTPTGFSVGITNFVVTFASNNIVSNATQTYYVNAVAVNSGWGTAPQPQGVNYIYIDYVK